MASEIVAPAVTFGLDILRITFYFRVKKLRLKRVVPQTDDHPPPESEYEQSQI